MSIVCDPNLDSPASTGPHRQEELIRCPFSPKPLLDSDIAPKMTTQTGLDYMRSRTVVDCDTMDEEGEVSSSRETVLGLT